MNPRVSRFHAAALQELRSAMRRYNEQVPGLGDELVNEVEAAVQRAIAHPDSGTPDVVDTRRMRVRRYPYSVVYARRGDHLIVLAVAHDRRRPGYWRARV